jgi:hypothetical protein
MFCGYEILSLLLKKLNSLAPSENKLQKRVRPSIKKEVRTEKNTQLEASLFLYFIWRFLSITRNYPYSAKRESYRLRSLGGRNSTGGNLMGCFLQKECNFAIKAKMVCRRITLQSAGIRRSVCTTCLTSNNPSFCIYGYRIA